MSFKMLFLLLLTNKVAETTDMLNSLIVSEGDQSCGSYSFATRYRLIYIVLID